VALVRRRAEPQPCFTPGRRGRARVRPGTSKRDLYRISVNQSVVVPTQVLIIVVASCARRISVVVPISLLQDGAIVEIDQTKRGVGNSVECLADPYVPTPDIKVATCGVPVGRGLCGAGFGARKASSITHEDRAKLVPSRPAQPPKPINTISANPNSFMPRPLLFLKLGPVTWPAPASNAAIVKKPVVRADVESSFPGNIGSVQIQVPPQLKLHIPAGGLQQCDCRQGEACYATKNGRWDCGSDSYSSVQRSYASTTS